MKRSFVESILVPALRFGAAGACFTVLIAWAIAVIRTDRITRTPANEWVYQIIGPWVSKDGPASAWPNNTETCWQISYYKHAFPGVQLIEIMPIGVNAESLIEPNANFSGFVITYPPPDWSMSSKAPSAIELVTNGDGVSIEQATGFPFLAMYGALVSKQDVLQTHWSVELPLSQPYREMMIPRMIPFRPIWTGFILNSLIWGLFFYFLVIIWKRTVIRARVQLNIRRDLCRNLKCGYPISGSGKCPECGTLQDITLDEPRQEG